LHYQKKALTELTQSTGQEVLISPVVSLGKPFLLPTETIPEESRKTLKTQPAEKALTQPWSNLLGHAIKDLSMPLTLEGVFNKKIIKWQSQRS
jgi:hypothetical protein